VLECETLLSTRKLSFLCCTPLLLLLCFLAIQQRAAVLTLGCLQNTGACVWWMMICRPNARVWGLCVFNLLLEKPTLAAHWLACAGSVKMKMKKNKKMMKTQHDARAHKLLCRR
jgi:hypothetical protein